VALADLRGINRVGIARMASRIGDALHLTGIERYAFGLVAMRAKGYKV